MFSISYFENEIYKGKNNRLREYFIKKNFLDFYNFINNKYQCGVFLEKLYIFSKGKNKCYCGNDTKFISFKKGYLEYCSVICSSSSGKTRKKYENTCLDRYGVKNVSKSDKIKKKKEETSLNNYGVKTYLQTEELKNKIFEKYGVKNVFQLDNIKEKIKETNLKKYGNSCPLLSDIIKEKTKKTNIRKYGVDHFSKTKKWKDNMKRINYESYIKDLDLPNNYKFLCKNGYNNTLKHDDCGNIFEIQTQLIRLRKKKNKEICRICNKIDFNQENTLKDYIGSIYDGEIIKYRDNRYEIDVYLPKLNIGFEYNGVYWHSELFKDSNYHMDKTNYFEDKGIRIIHIWEDDWIIKKDIIKSIIRSSLNLIENKIYGRNCKIKELTNKESRNFLIDNHLQGWCVSKYRYGLVHNNEIVSIITIGKNRINLGGNIKNDNYELLRYSNKINYTIVGGFAKLLKYIKNNLIINNLITYSDASIFTGHIYKKNGFKYDKKTTPGYYYLVDKVRRNRFNYNKSKLIKMGFDKNKTEREIMFHNGYYRIYDCGSYKFNLII